MKYILILILIFEIIPAHSQNISIAELERLIKLDLNETDLALNKLGLNYSSTENGDTLNCKVVTWDSHGTCKSRDCLVSFKKEFCETGELSRIREGFYNKTYFNNYRSQLEKRQYKLKETFTDENGLNSLFIKGQTIVILRQIKTLIDEISVSVYSLTIYTQKK